VVEQLGNPQGVLVVDETGFLKKGDKSAGVQPQYRGAAGRTANAQIGVFLTYAGPRGHTFLDRALYLPASWTDDRDRCRAAGIPADVTFATKPKLAQGMLERALDAGVPAAWVTADSIDGEVQYLRVWLEARPIGYVLAVSGKDTVVGPDWRQRRIAAYLADPPADGRQRLSAGDGAKGDVSEMGRGALLSGVVSSMKPDRRWSSGGHLGHDRRPPILKPLPTVRERDALSRPGLGAGVLALLLECRAEADRRRERAEPAQRIVPLLDAAVVLLDAVVLVATGAVRHHVAECLADGAGVGVVPVRRDLLGRLLGDCERLAEEAPGRRHIAPLAEQHIDEVPLAVDRPIQGAPAPVDAEGGLVRMPLRAVLSAPLGAQPGGQERREARLPGADRLVAEDEATFQKHLREVAQAQFVAQPPEHDEQDEVGRILQVVEGCPRPLVADPLAVRATEWALAQRRAA
jgi:hypothetical protein